MGKSTISMAIFNSYDPRIPTPRACRHRPCRPRRSRRATARRAALPRGNGLRLGPGGAGGAGLAVFTQKPWENRYFQWENLQESHGKPHISWENRWFPVPIFPSNWYLDLAHRSGISTNHIDFTGNNRGWTSKHESYLFLQEWVRLNLPPIYGNRKNDLWKTAEFWGYLQVPSFQANKKPRIPTYMIMHSFQKSPHSLQKRIFRDKPWNLIIHWVIIISYYWCLTCTFWLGTSSFIIIVVQVIPHILIHPYYRILLLWYYTRWPLATIGLSTLLTIVIS